MSGATAQRVSYLDGLRAIAVLAVLLAHTFPATFPDGVRGVDLFFVISGFCLSAPYLAGKAVNAQSFYLARLTRIAPPYYISLALFVSLAMTPFACPPFATPWEHVRAQLPAEVALFSIPLRPAIDLPFWTLAVEARWYVVCPGLIALYLRSRASFFLIGIALYALHVLWNAVDLGTLPCFMLGIVAADIKRHRFAASAAVLSLTVAILLPHGSGELDHGNPLWHAAAFFTVLAVHDVPSLAWRPMSLIGKASYSIYLTHFPILIFLQSHGIASVLSMLSALAVGLSFFALVERPILASPLKRNAEALVMSALKRLAPWVPQTRGA